MVADEHELLVEVAEVRVAPGAVGVESPLEHGARDVQRARDDAVALTIDDRADVDDQRSSLNGAERRPRFVAVDPSACLVEQLVERPPRGVDGHGAPSGDGRRGLE